MAESVAAKKWTYRISRHLVAYALGFFFGKYVPLLQNNPDPMIQGLITTGLLPAVTRYLRDVVGAKWPDVYEFVRKIPI